MSVEDRDNPKRVLLIYPYCREHSISAARTTPLGLGYIAAFLEQHGHEVSIVDLQVDEEESIYPHLKEVDLIGISTLTTYYADATRILRRIRESGWPGLVVLGGPHVSALPEETMRNPDVDVVCVGEGEDAMCDLVDGVPLAQVPSIYYRDNGRVLSTSRREPRLPLKDYPYPARHLYNLEKYTSSQTMFYSPHQKDASVLTSRGCPYNCYFCYKGVFGRKVRLRQALSVVEEMEYLNREYGYNAFAIIDDCFNVSSKRAKEICSIILQRGHKFKLTFSSGIRADRFDDELAGLMKRAGTQFVAFGCETGDEEILGRVGKHLNIQSVYEAVKICKKHNIFSCVFMIIGHIWDTLETVEKTIRVAMDIDPDICQFTVANPIPGSEFYYHALAENRLRISDYAAYNHYSTDPVYDHPNISAEDLARLFKEANKRFYLRARTTKVVLKKPWILINLLRHAHRSAALFFKLGRYSFGSKSKC